LPSVTSLAIDYSIARGIMPLDEMNPRGSLNSTAHFPWLQGERGLLKFFLHLASAEEAAVSGNKISRGCFFDWWRRRWRKKTNRSPRFLALLQSDSASARSAKEVEPSLIRDSKPWIIPMASSFVLVMLAWPPPPPEYIENQPSQNLSSRKRRRKTNLLPRTRPPAILVLNKQMRTSDLPVLTTALRRDDAGGGELLRHVDL